MTKKKEKLEKEEKKMLIRIYKWKRIKEEYEGEQEKSFH